MVILIVLVVVVALSVALFPDRARAGFEEGQVWADRWATPLLLIVVAIWIAVIFWR